MAAKKRFSESGARTPEIVGGQLLFVLGWVTIGTVGALLAGDYIISYTGVAAAVPIFVALLGSEAVYVSAERLLQSRGLVGKATWTDALRSYVTFALQLSLVLTGWGVAGMAYGLATATLLVTPITLYFVGVRPALPSRKVLASQWEYARYSLLSTLFGRVYERFDVLLLGYLLGPTAAGWYEVAFKLVAPAKFVAETASSGLMARVSYLSSRGEEIGEDVTNVLSYASILSIPIFFGALAIAEPLVVTVYGTEYAEAAPLLIVIALYHVVMTQNMTLTQTIYGLDFPRRIMWTSVVAVMLNVVLGVALVPYLGPVGVALATLAAEILVYVTFTEILREMMSDLDFFTPAFWKQCLVGATMFGVLYAISVAGLSEEGLTVSIYISVGGLTYFLFLFGISQELRETVRSVLTELGITWIRLQ